MCLFRGLLALFVCLGICSCTSVRPLLPDPPRPAAGFWFDSYRDARASLSETSLLAGSAKVKLTPPAGVIIAGHGFNKHSKGILDHIYARVVYLDSGPEAVVLVSLDFIGFSLPRTRRVRMRVTEKHQDRILIFATHNHNGPDTLGLWGPALFSLLPLRSGIDPEYMEWVESRIAVAIQRAVASARPASLSIGRFLMPEGLAVNMREAGDVDRTVNVLRVAAEDNSTIATLVHYANHPESLQDLNQWLSSDYPGVLYREVDRALGGVTLLVSGPAGGMIEPNNEPDDSERSRLLFRERLGGALAEGVIARAIGGMRELSRPELRVRSGRFDFPVQVGGLLELAMKLELLDPRPVQKGQVTTELAMVDLGPMKLLSVPGEPTPEVGRMLAEKMGCEYCLVTGLGLDSLGYMLSDRQWEDPRFEYERSMSLGPLTVQLISSALDELLKVP